jgi:N-acetyltransferase
MDFDPKPLLLTGRHVRLEPLAEAHAEGLWTSSQDAGMWTYLPVAPFGGVDDVKRWIDDSLQAQRNGTDVPFATVRRSDGRVVGSTRFLDIRRAHRGLEIGWTWLSPEARRTPINTEAKYLMLKHAFEQLGAIRVQLKSDARNQRSRDAMVRIGAVFEGILRDHMIRGFDGYVRSSAMFAFTREDWLVAKPRLEAMLAD